MALVGEEALERGEWFELEIGKRVRYEVYEEMLRVSQLGPDAPAPLFTSARVAAINAASPDFVRLLY